MKPREERTRSRKRNNRYDAELLDSAEKHGGRRREEQEDDVIESKGFSLRESKSQENVGGRVPRHQSPLDIEMLNPDSKRREWVLGPGPASLNTSEDAKRTIKVR